MLRLPASRRTRVSLGVLAAAILATVLVAPVVLNGGSGAGASCAETLSFRNRDYTARRVGDVAFVQSVAIGVGVASGCGTQPSNVDVRSVQGLKPTVAVAVPTDQSSIYVRRGTCSGLAGSALAACLRTATE